MLSHDHQKLIHAAAYSTVSVAMALVPLQATLEAAEREAVSEAMNALDVAYSRLMATGTAFEKPGCKCCSGGEIFNPIIREQWQREFTEGKTDSFCPDEYIDTLCAEGGAR